MRKTKKIVSSVPQSKNYTITTDTDSVNHLVGDYLVGENVKIKIDDLTHLKKLMGFENTSITVKEYVDQCKQENAIQNTKIENLENVIGLDGIKTFSITKRLSELENYVYQIYSTDLQQRIEELEDVVDNTHLQNMLYNFFNEDGVYFTWETQLTELRSQVSLNLKSLEELTDKVSKNSEQVVSLTATLANLNQTTEFHRNKINELLNEVSELKKLDLSKYAIKSDVETSISEISQRVRVLEEKEASVSSLIESLNGTVTQLQESVKGIQKTIDTLNGTVTSVSSRTSSIYDGILLIQVYESSEYSNYFGLNYQKAVETLAPDSMVLLDHKWFEDKCPDDYIHPASWDLVSDKEGLIREIVSKTDSLGKVD